MSDIYLFAMHKYDAIKPDWFIVQRAVRSESDVRQWWMHSP